MNQVNSIRVLTLQIMLSLLKMSMYETISTTGLYLPYLSFVSTGDLPWVGGRPDLVIASLTWYRMSGCDGLTDDQGNFIHQGLLFLYSQWDGMVWLVGTDISQSRAVGRSENPGVSSNVVGLIFPRVEIGLTDLTKSVWGPRQPPSPLAPTALPTFLSSSSSFGSFTQTIRARDSQLLPTVINLLILVLPPSKRT